MVDFPIVDSHIHLCDPGRFGYGWTKAAPSLARPVLPHHLTEAAKNVKIDEYVFVEANERPGLANHEPQPTAAAFIDYLFPGTTAVPQAWTPGQSV